MATGASNNFIGKLFNVSASGGTAAVAAFIAASAVDAGSPPETYGYVVATPTWVINQNVMQLVILSHADVKRQYGAGVGSQVVQVSYEITGDGGAALIAAMNANFVLGGSPATSLNYVQSVSAAQNFEALAICSVIQSN
jgi:hypothetical protein